jgi:SHS family lactate transporter-like MFS transporter
MAGSSKSIHFQGNPPNFSASSISRYLSTRLVTLKPPSFAQHKHLLNPIPALRLISRKQWGFILIAFAAWTWDAYDFFTVSLSATEIAKDLNRPLHDITWGITLVLMLRSIGAVIFGVLGDKFGRKLPFLINVGLFACIELGCGFVQTYEQFLAVRSLFGIIMGGIYGTCAATALDDCPVKARGIISGFLQQGYAFGYLLCVAIHRAADTNKHGWRVLFWYGCIAPAVFFVIRLFMGETEAFLAIKSQERAEPSNSFLKQAKTAGKTYWLIFIYMILFMSGMNFMSHGSQDLFPTFLSTQLEFSKNRSTVTNSVANFGALAGGIIIGHLSQFVGRRLCIMICCVIGGALIYPWAFIHNNGINASVFFLQFCVQGAWGVVPVYISDLSPPNFRTLIVGTAYQLGNLASSASSTIETTIGEQFPLYDSHGMEIVGKFNYGKVMAIFMGCVFGYELLVTLIGPEKRDNGSSDEKVAEDAAAQEMKLGQEKDQSMFREDLEHNSEDAAYKA